MASVSDRSAASIVETVRNLVYSKKNPRSIVEELRLLALHPPIDSLFSTLVAALGQLKPQKGEGEQNKAIRAIYQYLSALLANGAVDEGGAIVAMHALARVDAHDRDLLPRMLAALQLYAELAVAFPDADPSADIGPLLGAVLADCAQGIGEETSAYISSGGASNDPVGQGSKARKARALQVWAAPGAYGVLATVAGSGVQPHGLISAHIRAGLCSRSADVSRSAALALLRASQRCLEPLACAADDARYVREVTAHAEAVSLALKGVPDPHTGRSYGFSIFSKSNAAAGGSSGVASNPFSGGKAALGRGAAAGRLAVSGDGTGSESPTKPELPLDAARLRAVIVDTMPPAWARRADELLCGGGSSGSGAGGAGHDNGSGRAGAAATSASPARGTALEQQLRSQPGFFLHDTTACCDYLRACAMLAGRAVELPIHANGGRSHSGSLASGTIAADVTSGPVASAGRSSSSVVTPAAATPTPAAAAPRPEWTPLQIALADGGCTGYTRTLLDCLLGDDHRSSAAANVLKGAGPLGPVAADGDARRPSFFPQQKAGQPLQAQAGQRPVASPLSCDAMWSLPSRREAAAGLLPQPAGAHMHSMSAAARMAGLPSISAVLSQPSGGRVAGMGAQAASDVQPGVSTCYKALLGALGDERPRVRLQAVGLLAELGVPRMILVASQHAMAASDGAGVGSGPGATDAGTSGSPHAVPTCQSAAIFTTACQALLQLLQQAVATRSPVLAVSALRTACVLGSSFSIWESRLIERSVAAWRAGVAAHGAAGGPQLSGRGQSRNDGVGGIPSPVAAAAAGGPGRPPAGSSANVLSAASAQASSPGPIRPHRYAGFRGKVGPVVGTPGPSPSSSSANGGHAGHDSVSEASSLLLPLSTLRLWSELSVALTTVVDAAARLIVLADAAESGTLADSGRKQGRAGASGTSAGAAAAAGEAFAGSGHVLRLALCAVSWCTPALATAVPSRYGLSDHETSVALLQRLLGLQLSAASGLQVSAAELFLRTLFPRGRRAATAGTGAPSRTDGRTAPEPAASWHVHSPFGDGRERWRCLSACAVAHRALLCDAPYRLDESHLQGLWSAVCDRAALYAHASGGGVQPLVAMVSLLPVTWMGHACGSSVGFGPGSNGASSVAVSSGARHGGDTASQAVHGVANGTGPVSVAGQRPAKRRRLSGLDMPVSPTFEATATATRRAETQAARASSQAFDRPGTDSGYVAAVTQAAPTAPVPSSTPSLLEIARRLRSSSSGTTGLSGLSGSLQAMPLLQASTGVQMLVAALHVQLALAMLPRQNPDTASAGHSGSDHRLALRLSGGHSGHGQASLVSSRLACTLRLLALVNHSVARIDDTLSVASARAHAQAAVQRCAHLVRARAVLGSARSRWANSLELLAHGKSRSGSTAIIRQYIANGYFGAWPSPPVLSPPMLLAIDVVPSLPYQAGSGRGGSSSGGGGGGPGTPGGPSGGASGQTGPRLVNVYAMAALPSHGDRWPPGPFVSATAVGTPSPVSVAGALFSYGVGAGGYGSHGGNGTSGSLSGSFGSGSGSGLAVIGVSAGAGAVASAMGTGGGRGYAGSIGASSPDPRRPSQAMRRPSFTGSERSGFSTPAVSGYYGASFTQSPMPPRAFGGAGGSGPATIAVSGGIVRGRSMGPSGLGGRPYVSNSSVNVAGLAALAVIADSTDGLGSGGLDGALGPGSGGWDAGSGLTDGHGAVGPGALLSGNTGPSAGPGAFDSSLSVASGPPLCIGLAIDGLQFALAANTMQQAKTLAAARHVYAWHVLMAQVLASRVLASHGVGAAGPAGHVLAARHSVHQTRAAHHAALVPIPVQEYWPARLRHPALANLPAVPMADPRACFGPVTAGVLPAVPVSTGDGGDGDEDNGDIGGPGDLGPVPDEAVNGRRSSQAVLKPLANQLVPSRPSAAGRARAAAAVTAKPRRVMVRKGDPCHPGAMLVLAAAW